MFADNSNLFISAQFELGADGKVLLDSSGRPQRDVTRRLVCEKVMCLHCAHVVPFVKF